MTVTIGEKGVSVGGALFLCGLVAYGPEAIVIISFISIVLRVVKSSDDNKYYHILNSSVYKSCLNITMYTLSMGISGNIYTLLGGKVLANILPVDVSINQVLSLISQQAFYILVYIFLQMIINTVLFATFLRNEHRGHFLQEWRNSFLWSFVSLLFVGLMGVLMAVFWLSYNWFIVLLFIAPILLSRYSFSLYSNLRVSYMDTVKTLSNAIEAKDEYTHGHTERVHEYSALIADELKYSPRQKEVLQYAALLHDVGKIGVQEAILNKPGKLDKSEFDAIKQHPVLGAKIISNVKYLKECVPIVKYHHKYFDGTGYPEVEENESVPFESRILSVADAYDAMTSKRLYRDPFTHSKAIEEIIRCSGTQFDPKVVDAFIKAMEKRPEAKMEAASEVVDLPLETVKQ